MTLQSSWPNDTRPLRIRTSVPYTISISRAASLRLRPNARRQPTSEYRVHRVRVITANRCHRTWSQMRLWRTARRIPLHRWLSQRPVISPVPHRPVRRVSPPLREGRPFYFRRSRESGNPGRGRAGAGKGAVSTRKPRRLIRKKRSLAVAPTTRTPEPEISKPTKTNRPTKGGTSHQMLHKRRGE